MAKLRTVIRKKLQAEIDNFPFEYSFDDFEKHNTTIEEHFKNFKFANSFYRKYFNLEKEYFKFMILKNSQFTLSLRNYFEQTKKAKKDYSEDSYDYKCLNDLWKIFTVITNNYIVLSDLLLSGKDYQAKIIFRNTIELTELCICMLGNEEYYTFYKKKNAVEDLNFMFQTLKYGKMKEKTQGIISEIKKMPNNNIPNIFWDEYLKIRQEFYEDASRHVHANFLNIMFASHVMPMESDVINEKDIILHNLGGIINTKTKQNCKDVIMYDSISYMLILILVIEKHKLFFSKLDKDVNHLSVLSKLNWDLVGEIFAGQDL